MVPIFEKGVNMEGSGTNQHMFRRENILAKASRLSAADSWSS